MTLFLRRSFAVFWVFGLLATLISCTSIKVNTIPEPPPTAKLRIYVVAFSLGSNQDWKTSDSKFTEKITQNVERFLEKTGIYEVVNPRDIKAVIGDQWLTYYSIKKSDWVEARQIGNALHADFIYLVTREKRRRPTGEWSFITVAEMLNVKTGKAYSSQKTFIGLDWSEESFNTTARLVRENHLDLFNQAKHDMLSIAVSKGRIYTQSSAGIIQKPDLPPERKPQTPSSAKGEESPMVAKVAPMPPNLSGSGLIGTPTKDIGAKKLVVYDFDTSDQYRTVALILAEVLREEVFKLKEYVLVDREDLQKVLEEMALQQTGLLDDKDAVLTGKGLAADQVVTGKLGLLGKIFLMQAKRVDVQTISTLGIASLKFTEGQEDELLNKLPQFTRTLVGLE